MKFQAPNITTELGLEIGQIVFGVLNKIEILFSIILIVFFRLGKFSMRLNLLYAFIFCVILVQSSWLIPVLNKRAGLIINGSELNKSYHHITFVVLEIIKVIMLITAGIKFLKSTE